MGTKSHGTKTSFVLKNDIVHGGFQPKTSTRFSSTFFTSSSPFKLSSNAFVFASTFSLRKYPENVLTATVRSGTSTTLTPSLDGVGASLFVLISLAGKKNLMLYFCCTSLLPIETGAFEQSFSQTTTTTTTKYRNKRTVMEIFLFSSFSGVDITPMYFAKDMKLFP